MNRINCAWLDPGCTALICISGKSFFPPSGPLKNAIRPEKYSTQPNFHTRNVSEHNLQ